MDLDTTVQEIEAKPKYAVDGNSCGLDDLENRMGRCWADYEKLIEAQSREAEALDRSSQEESLPWLRSGWRILASCLRRHLT